MTGYAELALLMALAPPLPSEVVLPLAGYHVSTGALRYPGAVAAPTAGALVHATVVYTVARAAGGRLVTGRFAWRVRSLEGWFDRHGDRIVVLGRMLSG